jgi:acyl-CoA dehydrogenase
MLDFALSDEQKFFRDMVHRFAEQEMRPVAAKYDETGEFPWDVAHKAFDAGLLNIHVPAKYGGPGLGTLDGCIVAEELAWGCPGITAAIGITNLAIIPVLLAGSEEQRKRWLAPLLDELSIASYAVTEPGAGSDVAGISTTAVRKGDEYVLNGTKRFITGGGVASWMVCFAYTDKSRRHNGMSTFIVPMDTPGVTVTRKEPMMGQRCSFTAEIVLEDVVVAAENRLGREGDGFKIAMLTFNKTRPGVSAQAVGCARAAMEHATQYARERETFGKPVGHHQAIQFMLADMAMNVAAARWLAWHAAWLDDRGMDNAQEAAYAKAFAADMCMQVTTDAVQVFGGYGYSQEFPVEKLMRDAKIYQIYEGTSQIQRLIIGRRLLTP